MFCTFFSFAFLITTCPVVTIQLRLNFNLKKKKISYESSILWKFQFLFDTVLNTAEHVRKVLV